MREPAKRVALYDDLLARAADSPKLWNERGVALHQDGQLRRGGGELSSRARGGADVRDRAQQPRRRALSSRRRSTRRSTSFRAALDAQPTFVEGAAQPRAAAQPRKAIPARARGVSPGAARPTPENPVAWNGVGLVLAELRKFEDARNAFARAIQARPDFAEAHYNMSFTLSNLGDFEGALRETKRALELDPYYVAQKFELAMDVEYEDPDLSIQPDLGGEQRADDDRRGLRFDPESLDSLFTELAPAPHADAGARASRDPRLVAVRDGDGLSVEGVLRSRVGGDQPRAGARRGARRRPRAARRRLREAGLVRRSARAVSRSAAHSIPTCAARASAKRGRSFALGRAPRRVRSREHAARATTRTTSTC